MNVIIQNHYSGWNEKHWAQMILPFYTLKLWSDFVSCYILLDTIVFRLLFVNFDFSYCRSYNFTLKNSALFKVELCVTTLVYFFLGYFQSFWMSFALYITKCIWMMILIYSLVIGAIDSIITANKHAWKCCFDLWALLILRVT